MLAILVGYYLHPPLAGWLDALAEVKQRWSYVYSGLSAIVAGAFIPELMRIFIFQKARVDRLNMMLPAPALARCAETPPMAKE